MLVRVNRLNRTFAALFYVLAAGAGVLVPNTAHAALDCEQVIAVAQATVKLRDGGASLNSVMAEIERGDLQQKLDARELNLLRQIIRLSFTSEASVYEISESCKAGELGLPKPKP